MTPSNTPHLVDPELLSMLDGWPKIDLTPDNLGEVRVLARQPHSRADADAKKVSLDVRLVPGAMGAPDVRIHVYRPRAAAESLGCIFHIHGGGYVTGDVGTLDGRHRTMAAALGCAIVATSYRLAPETPAPGQIDDCYAALSWLFAHAGDIGIDRQRIGVMGESAGGGLAAALCLLVRDRGACRLSFQHLIYPMLDDRTCTRPDPHPHAGEHIWTPCNNRFGWSALLGHDPGTDPVSPYVAPARATDVSDLPPAFISTGSLDLFVEEDIEYARRLIRAGVPTELHVYPGGFHGFDLDAGAAVAVRARHDSMSSLMRSLRR